MHFGSHYGEHYGEHYGAPGSSSAIPQFPAHGSLVRLAMLFGRMASLGSLHGVLQQIGPIMVDLTGPLSVLRGDSLSYRLTVTDQGGARVNLTGYAIELEIKSTTGDPDPSLISKSVGAGITLLAQSGDTKGQADIVLTSDDTDINARPYVLDVVVSLGGIRTHVIEPRVFTVRGVVNQP